MSATTPLANANKYGSMTCVKFSTNQYICAYLEVEGTGAIAGKWTWSIYGKKTAPSTSDFTANQLPTYATLGLGTTTTYYPIAKFESISSANSSTPATKSTTTTSFLNDPNWSYWSATENKIDTLGKTINGRIQYKETKTSDANALQVLISIGEWAGTSFGGGADVLSGTTKAAYGAIALAATGTSNVTTTTTATGALALSTVASAIALALAF